MSSSPLVASVGVAGAALLVALASVPASAVAVPKDSASGGQAAAISFVTPEVTGTLSASMSFPEVVLVQDVHLSQRFQASVAKDGTSNTYYGQFDGDANLTFTSLPAGTYTLKITDEYYEFHDVIIPGVIIDAGEPARLGDIPLKRFGAVRGHATIIGNNPDGSNEPTRRSFSGMRIVALDRDGGEHGYFSIENDGSFMIVGLDDGAHTLEVRGFNREFRETSIRDVNVVDGQITGNQDVNLEWSGAVAATISDGHGRAIPAQDLGRTELEVLDSQGRSQRLGGATWDGLHYRNGLETGTYTVRLIVPEQYREYNPFVETVVEVRDVEVTAGKATAISISMPTKEETLEPAPPPDVPVVPPPDVPVVPEVVVPAVSPVDASTPAIQSVPGKIAHKRKRGARPAALPTFSTAHQRITWKSSNRRICKIVNGKLVMTGRAGSCKLIAQASATPEAASLQHQFTIRVR